MDASGAQEAKGEAMQRKEYCFLLCVLLSVAAAGCGSTATLERFQTFADTGTQYTTTVGNLLSDSNASGLPTLLVDANSVRLLDSRQLAPVSEADFRKQDEDMRKQLLSLRLLKHEVDLLGQYFSALASLADSTASTDIAQQLGDIGSSLSSLASTLGDTNKLATDSSAVSAAASDVGKVAVKGVQAHLLRKELETRGAAIAAVLRQQAAMLAALTEQAERAQGFLNQQSYEQNVVAPFLAGTTSANWEQARQAGLLQMPIPASLEAAVQAAASLRVAWTTLLADELGANELEAVRRPLATIDALRNDGAASSSGKERKTP
jgi:hypothetical protein